MTGSVRGKGLLGGLPHLLFGEGPPLVVFPGLGMTNVNPTGIQRLGEERLLAPLARRFAVHRVGRRVGPEPGTTMADLADDAARALEEGFGRAVPVLGMSTGGSLALQLAADRPRLRARGRRRGISRMQAPDVAGSRVGRKIAGRLLWLAGPLFIGRDRDPSDMVTTIEAEDAFDLGDRLGEILAPTLVVGGGRDRFYPPELFRETAGGIPNARPVLYENRAHGGTFADRRFGRDVLAFLRGEPSG